MNLLAISCIKCKANIHIPANRGTVNIVCPYCQAQFSVYSGDIDSEGINESFSALFNSAPKDKQALKTPFGTFYCDPLFKRKPKSEKKKSNEAGNISQENRQTEAFASHEKPKSSGGTSFFARRRAEREQKINDEQERVRKSVLTKALILMYYEDFSNESGEKVRWLRRGGMFRLEVYRSGVLLKKFSRECHAHDNESEGLDFEGAGYDKLPNQRMADYMRHLIQSKLQEIPYLEVKSDGLIFGNKNIRQGW
ncbi:MAG: hypothetical protein IJ404_04990 [Clostridia bacterium]|nr:hypothetical protein [Clostridia bacterium]